MITPPKKAKDWWNRKIKHGELIRRPKQWREWKPFKQRGLGLGKFTAGLLQSVTHHDDDMYEKLNYMGKEGGLGSFGERFLQGEDVWKPTHEWETWEDKNPTKQLSEWSDKDLFGALKSGDKNKVRGVLSALGIDDIGGEMSEYIMTKMPDIEKMYQTQYRQAIKPIEGMWDKFAKQYNIGKGGGFGTHDDSEIMDYYSGIEDKYGDMSAKVLADVINNTLSNITGQAGGE